MKQLLIGMTLMLCMTCYLMGNIGHFPLPKFLLLPDYVITEHSKDYYLWTNATLWSISYVAIYWSTYQVCRLEPYKIGPMPGSLAMVISLPIISEYYMKHDYYLPLSILGMVVIISAWQAWNDATKEFDEKRKKRTPREKAIA